MNLLLSVVLFLSGFAATASVPMPVSVRELVADSDHILVGRVVRVEMKDRNGKPITDVSARTGSEEENTIHFHLEIDPKQTLKTNAKKVPTKLTVPLAPHFHYELGQVADRHKDDKDSRVYFLKGKNFAPVKADYYFLSTKTINEIKSLLNEPTSTRRSKKEPSSARDLPRAN